MSSAVTSTPGVSAGFSHPRFQTGSVARVQEHSESTQSSLTLKVRTAEGDVVELSLDATSLRQLEKGSARTPQGSARFASSSESDTLNFNVKITGDLNDKELADISSLIQSLETGKPLDSSLSSLDAYKGSFTQTHSVSDSRVTLYA